ncbi:MAG TPA: sugar transferase [Candidatus Binataceae bacterium]|jgi:lipopolysaccharide/colanic/teichoic acid biosynthesis glycosyltransferase|nr:sugar transferase [Candidatus Binataceae bacterium]
MPQPVAGEYQVEDLGRGEYFVSIESVPREMLTLTAKRAIDVVVATAGILVCGLVFPWYAWRLRRESPGSVLFRQKRIGQNGRVFTLYKFRTMYPDAEEERLRELTDQNEMRGMLFKIKDDPRVTPTGRFMRRTHVDELPQFWNVLKGDMSLVGTRPPTENEVRLYQSHHYRRLSFKPGITGVWQINGNGKVCDFEEVVKLDCEYIDTWSLWQDCKILSRTLLTMARAEGW